MEIFTWRIENPITFGCMLLYFRLFYCCSYCYGFTIGSNFTFTEMRDALFFLALAFWQIHCAGALIKDLHGDWVAVQLTDCPHCTWICHLVSDCFRYGRCLTGIHPCFLSWHTQTRNKDMPLQWEFHLYGCVCQLRKYIFFNKTNFKAS